MKIRENINENVSNRKKRNEKIIELKEEGELRTNKE